MLMSITLGCKCLARLCHALAAQLMLLDISQMLLVLSVDAVWAETHHPKIPHHQAQQPLEAQTPVKVEGPRLLNLGLLRPQFMSAAARKAHAG